MHQPFNCLCAFDAEVFQKLIKEKVWEAPHKKTLFIQALPRRIRFIKTNRNDSCLGQQKNQAKEGKEVDWRIWRDGKKGEEPLASQRPKLRSGCKSCNSIHVLFKNGFI